MQNVAKVNAQNLEFELDENQFSDTTTMKSAKEIADEIEANRLNLEEENLTMTQDDILENF